MTDKDRYAVMGNPIGHSKSPMIHSLFASQTGQALSYEALLVPLEEFETSVKQFFDEGGEGLNVTVPFKQRAWTLSVHRSDTADRAGAVNTLGLNPDGELWGDNTDGLGLVRDILNNNHFTIRDKSLLVLGAGGAVRGVLERLLAESPTRIVIANRTESKAVELAHQFQSLGDVLGVGFDHAEMNRPYDLVINGTAASLEGELPSIPGLTIEGAYCYDMMYGGAPTVFMRWCEATGAKRVSDGLGMLVEQAAEAFLLWRGVRPETASVIKTVRQSL